MRGWEGVGEGEMVYERMCERVCARVIMGRLAGGLW